LRHEGATRIRQNKRSDEGGRWVWNSKTTPFALHALARLGSASIGVVNLFHHGGDACQRQHL
jgi:hypothetical protein